MLINAAFWLFSTIVVLSALGVVTVRNPVHAVLLLILCFFNASGLFVLAGAEYLAMTLVIVYVGAVAVLFLFVVMMLDIHFTALRAGFMKMLPFGLAVGGVLLGEIIYVLAAWPKKADFVTAQPMPAADKLQNAKAIGHILYTDYGYIFQICGLVLFVAMIGAIVLTHRQRSNGVLRQNAAAQTQRTRTETMVNVTPRIGQGVQMPNESGV